MTRAAILAVLEKHAHIVDDESEREELASALYAAMLMDPPAVRLRNAFCGCSSDGRVIKASANGRFLGHALDAAWQLARGA